MTTHLIVADAHCSPGDDLKRFEWLGNFILAHKPDKIICLGDWGTYDSISFYEHEGRKPTLAEDLKVAKEATDKAFGPMKEWNERRQRNRHTQYKPDTYELRGNHEDRIQRTLDRDPNGLGSVVDYDSLLDFGIWNTRASYGEYLLIDGIQYTHCPLSKMGRAITGLYRGLKIARESYYPTVYGHTHELNFSAIGILGQHNGVCWSMNAPAFMSHQHVEPYAKGTQTGWCYGLLLLTPSEELGVPPSFQYLSMKDLETQYG